MTTSTVPSASFKLTVVNLQTMKQLGTKAKNTKKEYEEAIEHVLNIKVIKATVAFQCFTSRYPNMMGVEEHPDKKNIYSYISVTC